MVNITSWNLTKLLTIRNTDMKKWFFLTPLFLLTIFSYTGCTSSVGTQITFRNLASNAVYVNFRANVITVPAGQTVLIKDVPKGMFDYNTTYEVPANSTASAAQGDVSGTVTIAGAGTKILILYSSTFVDGTYTIYATYSTNEDQSVVTSPTGP
jgi:hypothetical protein